MSFKKEVKIVDFRSDTFSLPSEEMRQAIHVAEVGDDVFGEDLSVQALEEKCAKLTGKEASCFVVSGTMGNLISILIQCEKRGSEAIVGSASHTLLFEQSNVAQFGGVNMRSVQNNDDGTFNIADVKNVILKGVADWESVTRLICVENTHNTIGGKVLPMEWIDQITSFAKSQDIPIHLDGARVFNASVKLNIPVSRIVRDFDTVTFCFSKGLGAPVGSMITGSKELMAKAKRLRKALGGTGRQIGFLAAAANYALDNMVDRLADDHRNLQKIANAIREAKNPNIIVPKAEDIHTNILIITLNISKLTSHDFVKRLGTVLESDENPIIVKLFPFGENRARIVTCCNNSHEDIQNAIEKIKITIEEFR